MFKGPCVLLVSEVKVDFCSVWLCDPLGMPSMYASQFQCVISINKACPYMGILYALCQFIEAQSDTVGCEWRSDHSSVEDPCWCGS